MARRHLHMPPAEWDALPWWEQQMYLEGYVWEELVGESEDSSDPYVTAREVHQGSNGTTITDTKSEQVLNHEPGEFAAYGIAETTLG